MSPQSRALRLTLAILAVLLFASPFRAQAQGFVQGSVVSAAGAPIPGLTASLAHPIVGRSSPSITSRDGIYVFFNVPIRQDPYYLEIYWGQTLMYRQPIHVLGALTLPPIRL
jgi:hypothetical protein